MTRKIIEVFEGSRKKLFDKVNSLNKKLKKYNSEIKIIEITPSVKTFSKFSLNTLIVTLEIPDKNGKEGVNFLGVYSFSSGVPMVFNNTEDPEIVINTLFRDDGICDHCGQNRHRKKWYFFEDAGQIKQIGSTCVQEYFGLELERILSALDIANFDELSVENFDDEDLGMFRDNSYDPHLQFSTIISYLNYVTNGFRGFWEKAPEGTTSRFLSHLFDKDFSLPKWTDEAVEKYKEKVKEHWNNPFKENKSDFEFNVYSNLYDGDGEFQKTFSLSNIGVILWAFWKALFIVEEKKRLSAPDVFIGTVGDRIEIKGTVKMLGSFDTAYGSTQIYGIYTPQGFFKWFASGYFSSNLASFEYEKLGRKYDYAKWADALNSDEGVKVKLKGTIKAHKVYNEKKETILTRCHLLSILEEPND